MKTTKSLKLITAIPVGLSFLAIIILSSWSSRMKGNLTGKKFYAFLAFQNSRWLLISISVKFINIHCHHGISNFVLHFHRLRSESSPLLLSLHIPFPLHHFVPYFMSSRFLWGDSWWEWRHHFVSYFMSSRFPWSDSWWGRGLNQRSPQENSRANNLIILVQF